MDAPLMSPPDRELLGEYVRHRSDAAFASLCSRYGSLVYASALRQVRDAHLAEDVTQAVFIVLSRRAAAVDANYLPGWLLKTTHFCALDALKRHRRRLHHEHEAANMTRPPVSQPPDDASADEVVQHIDAALSQLKAREGTAVALRFLENRPMAQVAATMGLSIDAVQKVIARSLPKLRRLLAGRGVMLSSTAALSDVLLRLPASPAPGALTTSVASVAAATVETLTIAKGAMHMMLWTKIKFVTAAAAAVFVMGSTGVVVLNSTLLATTSPPATAPGQAPQPKNVKNLVGFESPFLELVGCRIRQPVEVSFGAAARLTEPVEWIAHQHPEVRWMFDPALEEKLAAYSVSIEPAPGTTTSTAPQTLKAPKDVQSLPAGPVEPGEYEVKVAALDADAKPLGTASGRVTVKPLPRIQIMINDVQPDGSIRFTNVNQDMNETTKSFNNGGFMNSDFVQVENMTDDAGKPLKFTTTHRDSKFQYRYTLNQPVPPGKPLMLSNSGVIKGLVQKVDQDLYAYTMNHSPGGRGETRRIELYRLPAGAELLDTVPEDLPRKMVDDRIQVFVDVMIPAGGSNPVTIRYRLPGGN